MNKTANGMGGLNPELPKSFKVKLPFTGWYKNRLTFANKEHELSFIPYYRSDVESKMSLEDAIREGGEYIYFDGLEIEDES